MTPITTRWQKLEGNIISVLPATRLTSYEDLNQNIVSHFEISEPHSRLVVDSRASVNTSCKVDFDNLPYGYSHSDLPQCLAIAIRFFRTAGLTPEAWRLALDIKGDSQDVFQTSYGHLFGIPIRYVTNVMTHATEINKRGRCDGSVP